MNEWERVPKRKAGDGSGQISGLCNVRQRHRQDWAVRRPRFSNSAVSLRLTPSTCRVLMPSSTGKVRAVACIELCYLPLSSLLSHSTLCDISQVSISILCYCLFLIWYVCGWPRDLSLPCLPEVNYVLLAPSVVVNVFTWVQRDGKSWSHGTV